jgi:tetratricopeptide (TPR) repeat protein
MLDRCAVLLPLLALVLVAATPEDALRRQVEAARDGAALASSANQLEDLLRGASSPQRLEGAAGVFGLLVARTREIGAATRHLDHLIGISVMLRERIAARREELEVAAGASEAALEDLLRSEGWQRLDYGELVLGYWTGWALVTRGQVEGEGAERRRFMQAAQAEFSRASLALSLPRIATLSLLGLGTTRRELGDPAGARRALEQLEAQLSRAERPELLAPAFFELAVLAFADGDVERGVGYRARLPEGVLGRDASLGLVRAEAEARLKQAQPGDAEAERAAALLRTLSEAGGAHAETAVALVLSHRDVLVGQQVGPAGDLVRGESALAAGRHGEARDAYARVLASAEKLPGIDLAQVRYRHALAVREAGGDRAAAMRDLEVLLGSDPAASSSPTLRASAARLLYSMANAEVRQSPGDASEARATRAAGWLLEADPEAAEADHARYRLARSKSSPRGHDRIQLLEGIPDSSNAYPAARAELARLRADGLQREQNRGRTPGRDSARALLRDIALVRTLVAKGRLPADPERDATLAVLEAKAALFSGEPPQTVLELVDQAERRPEQGASGRRALLRVRLHALGRAGRFDEILSLLPEQRGLATGDLAVFAESLQLLEQQREPRPPAATLARFAEALAAQAPREQRAQLQLEAGRAWLQAEETDRALATAHELVEQDPGWGDARWLQARALEAAGDASAAARAWGEMTGRLEIGSPRWIEAVRAHVRTLHLAGRADAACRKLGQALGELADLDPALRADLLRDATDCPGSEAPDP